MNPTNNQAPLQKNKIYLILGIGFVVILLLLISVMSVLQKNDKKNRAEIANSNRNSVTTGEFSLTYDKSNNPQGIFRVGKPISIQMVVDSAGKKISDFDSYIEFSDLGFTVKESRSLAQDYLVAQAVGDAVIAVSGYTSVNSGGHTFDKQPLFAFDVVPTKQGVYTFTIVPKAGQGTTKFIDSSGNANNPALGTLRIVVVP